MGWRIYRWHTISLGTISSLYRLTRILWPSGRTCVAIRRPTAGTKLVSRAEVAEFVQNAVDQERTWLTVRRTPYACPGFVGAAPELQDYTISSPHRNHAPRLCRRIAGIAGSCFRFIFVCTLAVRLWMCIFMVGSILHGTGSPVLRAQELCGPRATAIADGQSCSLLQALQHVSPTSATQPPRDDVPLLLRGPDKQAGTKAPLDDTAEERQNGRSAQTRFEQDMKDLVSQWSNYIKSLEEGLLIITLPDKETSLDFVLVPSGHFTFGYTEEDLNRLRTIFARTAPSDSAFAGHNATPAVDIRVTKAFFLLDREVTVKQFAVFRQTLSSQQPAMGTSGKSADTLPPGAPDLPVRNVTWHEAMSFCNWLQSLTGLTVRLPTEIEWEYAARGPWYQPYPWPGNDQFYAWAEKPDKGPRPFTMGDYRDVAWRRIYDLSGNVSEWCLNTYEQDLHKQLAEKAKDTKVYCYDPYSDTLVEKSLNAPQPNAARVRTYRGGSYRDHRGQCEVCTRRSAFETQSDPTIGFRPVLLLSPPSAAK